MTASEISRIRPLRCAAGGGGGASLRAGLDAGVPNGLEAGAFVSRAFGSSDWVSGSISSSGTARLAFRFLCCIMTAYQASYTPVQCGPSPRNSAPSAFCKERYPIRIGEHRGNDRMPQPSAAKTASYTPSSRQFVLCLGGKGLARRRLDRAAATAGPRGQSDRARLCARAAYRIARPRRL